MTTINLNANVSVKTLYADLQEEQIAQIEEAAKDGFTEDELQKLEDSGIDTTLIKNNSQPQEAQDKQATQKASIEDKVAEIKAKYPAASGGGFDMNNPELQAFSKAMDDGLLAELGKAGYTKNEIVDIINQAFPTIGIRNKENGKYECPRGHGDDAKAVYNKFVEEITKATNLNSAELLEAQNKLSKISSQITENNRQLKNLEYNITILQDQIERKIEEAIEESKDITEDQKDNAKQIVSKRLSEYTSSNGSMTYEDFQKGVASDLDELAGSANSKLSAAVLKIINAQKEMGVLSGYLTKMNDLINTNTGLASEATNTQNQITKLTEAAAASASDDADCERCDPIGFTDTDGTRFDFFVDKDSDGNVTNENEFLGAENGFQEMIEADANGDGKVTADELDGKDVKVVVTNKDGSQEVKNASEVLKEGDNIDLSSYQAQNTELENGNALLGTFNVNKDGQTLDTGYQTLDKLDWLDDNFEFSDEINGVGRHIRTEGDVAEVSDYTEKYNLFMQNYSKLEQREKEAQQQLGFDLSEVKDGIANSAKLEAQNKASKLQSALSKTEAKKEEAQKTEEEAKAQAKAEEEAKEKEEEKEKEA